MWAQIRSAINSNLAVPLNTLITSIIGVANPTPNTTTVMGYLRRVWDSIGGREEIVSSSTSISVPTGATINVVNITGRSGWVDLLFINEGTNVISDRHIMELFIDGSFYGNFSSANSLSAGILPPGFFTRAETSLFSFFNPRTCAWIDSSNVSHIRNNISLPSVSTSTGGVVLLSSPIRFTNSLRITILHTSASARSINVSVRYATVI